MGMGSKNKLILFPVILSAVAIGLFFTMSFNVDDSSNESKTITYIPSDITKANPNFVVEFGAASMAPTTAAQKAESIVYTLEGTVTNIDEPVLYVTSNGNVKAAIPIIMSVEKVHKGNLDSDTFTFYLNANVSIDGYIATSYSAIGKDVPVLPYIYRDYTISEIINSENIEYKIHSDSAQYEIDDKIIIHLGEDTKMISAINSGSFVVIGDYDLTSYYGTTRGKSDVYKIQEDVLFNYQGITQQYSIIINERQASP